MHRTVRLVEREVRGTVLKQAARLPVEPCNALLQRLLRPRSSQLSKPKSYSYHSYDEIHKDLHQDKIVPCCCFASLMAFCPDWARTQLACLSSSGDI